MNRWILFARELDQLPNPVQCFGILSSQVKKYGDAKVELACKRALSLAHPSYRLVKLLLHTGLENLPDQLSLDLTDICHSNIRGPEHFN